MEEIEVNGKVYVLKADIEKEKGKFPKLTLLSKEMLLDEANVLGVGTVQVGEEYHSVRLSTKYLEKIITTLKQLSFSKGGLESIDIVWAKDYPCIIGRLGQEGKVSGFILAPKIVD